MSLLFEGRLHLFAPVTYLDKVDITVIRPMIFCPKSTLSARRSGSACPW
jgi:hypothetical protein